MIEQPGIQKQAQQPILVTVSNPNQIPVAFQPTIKTEAVSTTPQQTLQNQVSVVQAQPPMSGTVLVPTATATTEQLLLQPKQQLPQQMQQQQLQQQQLQQHLQTQLQTQQLKTQTLQTLTPPSAKSSSSRQGQILGITFYVYGKL
jgi:malic enzyme